MSDHPCTVSGHSDDLIEIDGAISEEFTLPSGDKALLAFSTGVVLRIEFDRDGQWRIRPVKGASRVELVLGGDTEDDIAHLTQAPAWVVLGTDIASAK